MKGRPIGSKNREFHIWSEEEKEYLKKITPGNYHKKIQELMNKKFKLDLTTNQIKGAIGRCKLNTGITGQFKKGHTPTNKGVKGIINEGSKKTWFKKGNESINYKSLGSERIRGDGYIEIKVAEPHEWKLKHRVIWEEHNGPIPEKHNVIFGDSDKSNFGINNLILVSKKQLLTLNRNNLIQNDADLTRTGLIIADIYDQINKIKK